MDPKSIHAEALREACRMLCRTGKFETGGGTCAPRCMDQLGDPRSRSCPHVKIIHGAHVVAVLSTYLGALSRHGLKVTGPEATDAMVDWADAPKYHVTAAGRWARTEIKREWTAMHETAPTWPPED